MRASRCSSSRTSTSCSSRTCGTCAGATPTCWWTRRTASGPLRPAVDPLRVGAAVVAVATHGHFDHTGGLHEFDDRRCHPDDEADVREPYRLRLRREDFDDEVAGMYAYYGYPVPDLIVGRCPPPTSTSRVGDAGRRAHLAARRGRRGRPRRPRVRGAAHAGPHRRLDQPVGGPRPGRCSPATPSTSTTSSAGTTARRSSFAGAAPRAPGRGRARRPRPDVRRRRAAVGHRPRARLTCFRDPGDPPCADGSM